MKVIFLDIDGVLNYSGFIKERTPSGVIGISNELISNLKEIVNNTGAQIVLISDWKDLWEKDEFLCKEDAVYLNEKLKIQNLSLYNKTNNEYTCDRGKGIHDFLKENNVESFVILDDVDNIDYRKYNLKDNLVKTTRKLGLTKEDVQKAILILNNKG